MTWTCYLIHAGRRTYIGKTNNLRRRLRQHNGALAGGAKATRGRGPWTLAWYVTGFTLEQHALQFEWRMHHPPQRRPGLVGRLHALAAVCALPRWTRHAPLAPPLHVHAPPDALDSVRTALANVATVTVVAIASDER